MTAWSIYIPVSAFALGNLIFGLSDTKSVSKNNLNN